MNMPLVWVISSDPDVRWVIRLNLSKRGLKVMQASLDDELTLTGVKPHLVILEVSGGEEAGWELAYALRERDWLRGVPMVLVLEGAPMARQVNALHPVHWLERPLAMDALLAMVRDNIAWPGGESDR